MISYIKHSSLCSCAASASQPKAIAIIGMFTAVIIISSFTAGIVSTLTISSLQTDIQTAEDIRLATTVPDTIPIC